MSKSIVQRLKDEIRKADKRGISRYRIAKRTGLSEAQLSRMMNAKAGKGIPKLDTAERIAQAIGCKIILARAKEYLTRSKYSA
jgi:transcriptional regulator with XRE-family HTH domain